MICACCNRPVDPEWAMDHNMCPVCWRSGCTAHHAEHSEAELAVQAKNERKKREDEHKTDRLSA